MTDIKAIYKKDILTVVKNKVIIGYMIRDYTLLGCGDYSDGSWYITKQMYKPQWLGPFKGRRKARHALEERDFS